MDSKITFALMASGVGSNAENLIRFLQCQQNARVACLITNNKTAPVIQKCEDASVPCHIFGEKDYFSRFEQERQIIQTLQSYNVSWILLAGYMRILSQNFIDTYYDEKLRQSRIINIHPSLLPAYRGTLAYERAFEDKVKYSGVTVHFVDHGVDTGTIIVQEKFQRFDSDTFDDFKNRGLALEHTLYRLAISNLLTNGDRYANCTI